MTLVLHLPDFRTIAGYFLVCTTLLLPACKDTARQPESHNTAPPDGSLRFSAALSYEDRQMMRHYLVRGLHDGMTTIAIMQEKIESSPD